MLTNARVCCLLAVVLGIVSAMPEHTAAAASESKRETLAADTPTTTVLGNTFVAPAAWTRSVRGRSTMLEAPEGGSFLVVFDVPTKEIASAASKDGWTDVKRFSYQISPNEKRGVGAEVRRANDVWTVLLYDMAQDVAGKRGAQVGLVLGILPKGITRESFAGKKTHALDPARIAELSRFVEKSIQQAGIPGASVALYQGGRTVFSGGFGVRELGKPAKVDADTKYLIASNTKALATLMLAKLVDAKKLTWDTPATSALPNFKLGNADTTRKVQIKHLICACTGMPRQDLESLLEFGSLTPAGALKILGTMQPTSEFGALYQYSNPMAAAAGYLGGHVAYPDLEFGAAYDRAMQSLVFEPLNMMATTHDFAVAQRGNFAAPHAPDVNGRPTPVQGRVNLVIVPMRPAAGAWSSVNDMIKYVAMELAEGKLPNGQRYISRDALLARRAPQVAVGTDVTYGMGLRVDNQYGTPVVHHGGDLPGFHSDMMWLPEHGVGAVILTNGDPSGLVRSFRRKLLEVLFDGRAEADEQMSVGAKTFFDSLAAERKLVTIPADPALTAKLAARYQHPAVGEIAVARSGGQTVFNFGERSSPMASRKNPDGTTSFITIVPGFGLMGREFIAAERTLTLRHAQHEYVFKAE